MSGLGPVKTRKPVRMASSAIFSIQSAVSVSILLTCVRLMMEIFVLKSLSHWLTIPLHHFVPGGEGVRLWWTRNEHAVTMNLSLC
ncbi:hypothetical protein ECG_09438 [Echinococcus granulosus]|uniref:Secreted protein n=1 Tax=Echinococcus granulosus TaxID=6210 RepID=A0A068WQF1_ECHGR|nr:hypothetical protein ECG_09438 [Echinococcus granulosus]CDS20728.1 hypothetical protein EgrG_001143800 [Echinococcus granulosus]